LAKKGVSLRARVQELERQLAESVPKSDAEALKNKIKELEAKLANPCRKLILRLRKRG